MFAFVHGLSCARLRIVQRRLVAGHDAKGIDDAESPIDVNEDKRGSLSDWEKVERPSMSQSARVDGQAA